MIATGWYFLIVCLLGLLIGFVLYAMGLDAAETMQKIIDKARRKGDSDTR